MKKIVVLLMSMAVVNYVTAQKQAKGMPKPKSNKVRCFTDQAMKQARLANPNIETDEQFENWMAQKIAARKAAEANGTPEAFTSYYLPIVFHIIHSGEAVGTGTNISQALINAQVAQLNRDFGNLSGSSYAVAANTGIKFGLAVTNPSGVTLSEPGIDRINYSSKGWTAPPYDGSSTYFINTIKPASIWDPTKYINVWLCDQSSSGLLGIATFPGSSTLQGLDNLETNTTAGVVIEVTSVGSKYTSPDCGVTNQYDMGRTVTHELGHFFGLRHIWGDATTCTAATDYCNDTPKSLYENYGKPTHPKPNTCGTADEMFENYMDYSDDQVLNTFTANQVDRIQTVMLNSPRRLSLVTSPVAKVLPSDNSVSFDNCMGVMSVFEKGTTGTTSRYTDVKIPISVAIEATGAATLAFTTAPITGVTPAVAGIDYQILNPSITLASGDNGSVLNVRILDNARVDGQRGVHISYTINGSGVAAASSAQSMDLYINDDDNIIVGQNSINLLSEDFASGSLGTGWSTLKSAAYTSQWVVGNSGDAGGTAPNAYISSNTSTKPNTYTTLPSGQTFCGAIIESPLIEASRVSSLGNLSFKFKVKGRTYSTTTGAGHYGQLFFVSDDDPNNNYNDYGTVTGNTGRGPWANTNTLQTGTPSIASAFLNNSRFHIDWYWTVSSTSAASNPGLNIDNIALSATPWNVETTLSNSYTFNTIANTENNFRNSATSKAILKLTAQSSNANDVVAAITEAGTDRPTFTTDGTTFFRSRKVFKLSSGSAATQHTVTLYFTQAEVAAWTTPATVKLMKVNDGVNITTDNITTLNAIIVTPTVTDKLTTDGYIAYTATFTGFGQYVIVEQAAVLPLKWGLFTGVLDGNKAQLNWTVSDEINNTGFNVERSTNGGEFIVIGFVKSNNTAASNTYNFTDATISKGNRYNYRLKQIDVNGKCSYSNIVSIFFAGKNDNISVYPNPVNTQLTIQLGTVNKTTIRIVNIEGKQVYQNDNINNTKIDINTIAWVKGSYFVTITNNAETQTFKIIKD